jgi:glycerol uptake facilitator protein
LTEFVAEIIGTAILITFGSGVVANVLLKDTKGNNSGWIVITFGWGLGVFIAVFTVGKFSGAHINPAVTIGLALAQKFPWIKVPQYIFAQLIGAYIGASLVWIFYQQHFKITDDKNIKLGIFATIPQIRNYFHNFISEVIGTFVLIFGVLHIAAPEVGIGSLDALPVGFLVLAIGLSLGGTTGYAINPARDLGPRLAHFFLPIPEKGNSDWPYAWVPILGPITGAIIAASLYNVLN